ncbi:hypothetical protein [Gorillibacterium massiliense]|uniref:hypothetical protein n=1 Tax=Gorillibacterium massiliense TaxID=1280390 RepID=UPI0004B4C974|nr:hypothetical protein [Gorillibacterium massiliense]
MNITVIQANMQRDEEQSYEGRVLFSVEGHSQPYECTLYSKKGNDWMYSLHFAEGPGKEEDIEAVEAWIEEDDEGFDGLIDAAMSALAE